MSELCERLTKALEASGKNKMQLARACGISHPAVTNWFNGKTKELTAANAVRAAQFLGVSIQWLAFGEGDPKDSTVIGVIPGESALPDGVIAVPEYKVTCGAGNACEPTYEEATESRPAYYREDELRILGVSSKNLRRLVVHGDSMIPVLFDRDKILCSCEPQAVVSGKIYAFCYGSEVRVKRLYPLLSGGLRVHSENAAIPDEDIPPECMSQFYLIGRVIDRSGRGPL